MIADNLKELGGEIQAGDTVRIKGFAELKMVVGRIHPATKLHQQSILGTLVDVDEPARADCYWVTPKGKPTWDRLPIAALVKVGS